MYSIVVVVHISWRVETRVVARPHISRRALHRLSLSPIPFLSFSHARTAGRRGRSSTPSAPSARCCQADRHRKLGPLAPLSPGLASPDEAEGVSHHQMGTIAPLRSRNEDHVSSFLSRPVPRVIARWRSAVNPSAARGVASLGMAVILGGSPSSSCNVERCSRGRFPLLLVRAGIRSVDLHLGKDGCHFSQILGLS